MYINPIIISSLKTLSNYLEIQGDKKESIQIRKLLKYISKTNEKYTKKTFQPLKNKISKNTYNFISELLDNKKSDKLDVMVRKDKRLRFYENLKDVKGFGSETALKFVISHPEILRIDEIKGNFELSNLQQIGLEYFDDLNSKLSDKVIKTYIKQLEIAQAQIPKEIIEIIPAGSFRRKKKNHSDFDCLIITKKRDKNIIWATILEHFSNSIILVQGNTNMSFISENKVDGKMHQIDLKCALPSNKYFALLHFTGNSVFGKKIRKLAIKKKMKLSEYGLFNKKTDKPIIKNPKSEKEIFKALNIDYIPPEKRTFKKTDVLI